MKITLSFILLLGTNAVLAKPQISKEFQIKSLEIIETTHLKHGNFNNNPMSNIIRDALQNPNTPVNPTVPGSTTPAPTTVPGNFPAPTTNLPPTNPTSPNSGFDPSQVGRVISVAKDFVALGESIYELVKKGRPTNTTSYNAISVVPKDPMTKEAISPFDLEGFSVPEERSFTAIVKNGFDQVVVKFDYQLVYSYGGSFEGNGKYLTGVMVVPKSVHTSFGWDFNATMKLDAIMNHGSKANPVAGALVTIKYQMNSWTSSFERNDTLHVTGAGQVKSFGIR